MYNNRRMRDCDICRGAGVIRLPIYRRITTLDSPPPSTVALDEISRTFPCPECGGTVAEDNVCILQASARIDQRHVEIGAEHTRRNIAHSFVDLMINDGLIQFTEKTIRHEMAVEIRATVGVVSKRTVASMTQRIRERQMEIAVHLAAVARASISNWASRYTDSSGSIAKDQAMAAVTEALQHVSTEETS